MSRYFTALTDEHRCNSFHCGEPVVDGWLHHTALEAQTRRHSARTFVLVDDGVDDARSPLAYFALAAHAVDRSNLPDDLGRRQPTVTPAVLLARLGTHIDWQGQHLGAATLKRAVRTAGEAHQLVAMPFVVVDSASEDATDFYLHFGFKVLPTDGERTRLVARSSELAAVLD